jgi:DNA invertase Pin-like site-specific DNA recombinase
MRHRHWVPGIRAGAASLVAALALLCLPGTTIAGRSSTAAAKASDAPSAPLTRGVGFDRPDGAAQVRALQRRLQELGQRPGPVDGLFGPLTEAAVIRFQRREGLTVDGIVGDATMGVLRRKLARTTEVRRDRRRASASLRPRRKHNGQPNMVDVRSGAATGATAPARSSKMAPSGEAMLLLAGAFALGAGAALVLPRVRPTPRRQQPGREKQGERLLGYASVSRSGPGRPREDVGVQLQAIMSECRRRRLVLVDVVREREPENGKGLQRPGLDYAFRRIAEGEASGLVVADLSRLSRSVADLGQVLERIFRAGARLVSAAPDLDTGERSGLLAARALIGASSWERERLSERTRKGLEAARRAGRRGRPSGAADNPDLRERIPRMRAEGMTLQAIADRLNEEGVPTVRGGAKWRPSSVQTALGYRRPRDGAPGRAPRDRKASAEAPDKEV